MRYRTEKHRIGFVELTYLLIGALLLLLMGVVAKGQSPAPAVQTVRAHSQNQQPLYAEYRGVRLGMTAAEARAKLGEPAMKSNEQDYFVLSANETTQIVYDAFQKKSRRFPPITPVALAHPITEPWLATACCSRDLMVRCSEWCSISRRECGFRTTRAPLSCR